MRSQFKSIWIALDKENSTSTTKAARLELHLFLCDFVDILRKRFDFNVKFSYLKNVQTR